MKRLFSSLAVILALTACGGGSHSVPVIGPDGQPTGQSVQQPDGPGMGTGALLGGLAGFMLGRAGSGGGGGYHGPSGSYQQPTTVINKTVVNKTVINKAPAQTVSKPPIPSYTKPSGSSYSRPSTGSYSRPSVPSYSRPSGGGFRSGRR